MTSDKLNGTRQLVCYLVPSSAKWIMLKEQLKYRISKSSSVARPGSRSEDRSPSPGYNLMSEKLRRSSSGKP